MICHMTTSIDGKVTGKFLETPQGLMAADEYYRVHRDLHADAFACGRITMEGSFTGGWYPDLKPFEGVSVSRDDHVADPDAGFFCVAFDRRGRLGWKTPVIEDYDPGYDGAHIVEVLCEDVKDAYLAWLRSAGISYIFAGSKEMDLSLALSKLRSLFKIFGQGFSVIQSPRGIALLFLLLYLYPLFLLFLLYANKRLRMCVLCDILYV